MSLKNYLVVSFLIVFSSSLAFGAGYLYKNLAPVNLLVKFYETRFRNVSQLYEGQIKELNKKLSQKEKMPTVTYQALPSKKILAQPNWSGPEFWQEITNKRAQQALSPIPINELLCTLAAIRLADLRRLGRLDDHEGFKPLINKYQDDLNREDLLNLFEFLTSGAPTGKEAVDGLYNTLGHKALFTEIYKAGCAYAADGFGVVVTSK